MIEHDKTVASYELKSKIKCFPNETSTRLDNEQAKDGDQYICLS